MSSGCVQVVLEIFLGKVRRVDVTNLLIQRLDMTDPAVSVLGLLSPVATDA